MVKRCIVCKKLQGKDNRTYHRLPKDVKKQPLWLMCLSMSKENIPNLAYICSQHFHPNDFERKPSGIVWLKKEAVPNRSCESPIIGNYSDDNSCTTSKEADLSYYSSEEQLEFLTVVEDVDDTDEDSVDGEEFSQTSLRSESRALSPVTIETNFSGSNTVTHVQQASSSLTTQTRDNFNSTDTVAHKQQVSSEFTTQTRNNLCSTTVSHNIQVSSPLITQTRNNVASTATVSNNIQVSPPITTQTRNNCSSSATVSHNIQVSSPLTTQTQNNVSSTATVFHNIIQQVLSALTAQTKNNFVGTPTLSHNIQQVSSPLTAQTGNHFASTAPVSHNIQLVSSPLIAQTRNNFASAAPVSHNNQLVPPPLIAQTRNNFASTATVSHNIQQVPSPLTAQTGNNFVSTAPVSHNIQLVPPPLIAHTRNNFASTATVSHNIQQVPSPITAQTGNNFASTAPVSHNIQLVSSPLIAQTRNNFASTATVSHNIQQVSSPLTAQTRNNFASTATLSHNIQQVSSPLITQTRNNISNMPTVSHNNQQVSSPLTAQTKNNFSGTATVAHNPLEKEQSTKLILIPSTITYPVRFGSVPTLQYQPVVPAPPKGIINSNLLIQNPILTSSPAVSNNLVPAGTVVSSTISGLHTQPMSLPNPSLSNGNSTVVSSSQLESPHVVVPSASSPMKGNASIVNTLNDKCPSAKPNGSDSSSTLTGDEVDKMEGSPRKRKIRKRLPRYFGDCSSDDMETPGRARVSWNIAKRTISNLKSKVKMLQRQKKYYARKVNCLNSLLHYLEENNFLNQYADAVVKAVLPERLPPLDKNE